jgi:hypothetical protein
VKPDPLLLLPEQFLSRPLEGQCKRCKKRIWYALIEAPGALGPVKREFMNLDLHKIVKKNVVMVDGFVIHNCPEASAAPKEVA